MRAVREKHDKMKRTHCSCFHCAWKWTSSQELPRVCPNCHSPWWDKPIAKKERKEESNDGKLCSTSSR